MLLISSNEILSLGSLVEKGKCRILFGKDYLICFFFFIIMFNRSSV